MTVDILSLPTLPSPLWGKRAGLVKSFWVDSPNKRDGLKRMEGGVYFSWKKENTEIVGNMKCKFEGVHVDEQVRKRGWQLALLISAFNRSNLELSRLS
jgi:hypothetical protein